jgi:hypothetical protein
MVPAPGVLLLCDGGALQWRGAMLVAAAEAAAGGCPWGPAGMVRWMRRPVRRCPQPSCGSYAVAAVADLGVGELAMCARCGWCGDDLRAAGAAVSGWQQVAA